MLAEAAPAHLCTHANAFVAKSPIKASDDTWKGLPVNRLRTVRIGVGPAQGGRGERPSRAEGVRACARRACVRVRARAQSVHGMQAARLGSVVRRPFADLPICQFEPCPGEENWKERRGKKTRKIACRAAAASSHCPT